MNTSRWLGLVGGVLLCVSAFTPLRTSPIMQLSYMAINDMMIVDNGGWILLGAGLLAIFAGLIGRRDALIIASVASSAAAAFVAGSMRATLIQLQIYGDELIKSDASKFVVASWGWLLVVAGVVLVTAAAIVAKIPQNNAPAISRQPQAGE